MPFKFTGDSPLLYTQYRDLGTDQPLYAVVRDEPYDMIPVGGWNLSIPPADGRWESAPGDPPEGGQDESEPGSEGGLPPLPLISGTGTEGEEN